MAHIIINPSLSAAIGYKFFFNPPKFAVVIAILEPANSTRTDNSNYNTILLIELCNTVLLIFIIIIVFTGHLKHQSCSYIVDITYTWGQIEYLINNSLVLDHVRPDSDLDCVYRLWFYY